MKVKKIPMRSCVVTNERIPKQELLRIVKTPEGEVKPDILRPFLSALMANCLCRPDFIAYQHTDYPQPFFQLCRLFRPTTLAWTIRNQEEYAAAKQTFDSVIFEGFSPEDK